MSKSYFPTDRAGRTAWYDNFAKEFPKVGKDLGFSDAEITNAVNDAKYAVHILNTLGPDIDADPSHAGNAVLSGQSSGDYVDLPDGGSALPIRNSPTLLGNNWGSTAEDSRPTDTKPSSVARGRPETL